MKLDDVAYIFYDFDGVMTNNCVLIGENGREYVTVNRSDGYAVSRLKHVGIRQMIISSEINPIVKKRARKLGIAVRKAVSDKGEEILEICKREGINPANTVFIGNDLNDLTAFQAVGFKGAPKDAEKEILMQADWVSEKRGGEGVIRDFYRFLIGQA